MRSRLREVTSFFGEHFDEFIIDDFFFTNCTCADCLRERDAFNKANGIDDGSWQAWRLDLMHRISKEDVIEPVRKVNPACRITIKYPNWAESYQETGYNPKEQRKLFDRIYTGTETRDPVSTDQHLPRYLSYSLMTYFENMWPGHNGGGWFDNFGTHITEQYLEQAYLTAFSKPQEMMLFCFQSLYDNMYTPALGFQLDRLDALLEHAGDTQGIVCYLPDNCQGEDNVQDFLGMAGLPIILSPYFPEKAAKILLTASAACDPEILDRLGDYLIRGGTAMVTTGFIQEVKERGFGRFSSIRMRGRHVSGNRYRVELEEKDSEPGILHPVVPEKITIPVAEFRNNATWAVVKLLCGEESDPILLRDYYGEGCLWTLAVPDAFPEIYKIAPEALGRIRQAMSVNGVWFEGPSGISLFLYDNDSFILYDYVMDSIPEKQVRVHVKGASALVIPQAEGFSGIMPVKRKQLRIEPLYTDGEEAVFDLTVQAGKFVLYQVEQSSRIPDPSES